MMQVMVAKGKKSIKDLEAASKDPMGTNEKLLMEILKRNKDTEYGKLHGFADIHSVEEFRANVPLSTYDDFAPYIERLKEGEENLLTKSKVIGYSRTSGSSGVPKYIPATNESLSAYTKYTWTRALALAALKLESEGKRYKSGRGLYSSPAMNTFLPNGLPCSNIAEIGARHFGVIYPYILTLPTGKLFDMHDGDYLYNMFRFALMDEDTSFIFSVFYSINVSQMSYLEKNWRVIVDDIAFGTINESIDMKPELREKLLKHIKPMPRRAIYLRKQFEQGFDSTLLKRLWPNLCMMSGIGSASFKSSADRVRKTAGNVPLDFSIYGASEGLVAACYELENDKMQLLTDSCFYEFIPENDENGEVLTVDQLELGKRYEVVITTQAGLYRYRLKDIFEVVGFRNKMPLINFVYRRGQLLNLSGEKFTEEDARTTISMFEKAHGISIDNWIFYQDDSVCPSRYALLAECEGFDLGDEHIDELEGYMGECCKRYPDQRAKFFIGRMTVQKQVAGTHAAWKQRCADAGAYQFQIKPVHSLDNDAKREFFLSRIEEAVEAK